MVTKGWHWADIDFNGNDFCGRGPRRTKLNVDTTTLPNTESAFHTDDVEQVADYRTLSALAIVGLLFGLASPLCFAAPLFLAIPLFGAAVSLVALRRIAASDGALAGQWAAAGGLMLCVAVGVAAISRDWTTRYLRSRQAASFGRDWIALLVAGHTEPAFRLTIDGARPAPPPEPGTPAPTRNPYDAFLDHPQVKALQAAAADSAIRLDETLGYNAQPRGQFYVRQRFRIMPTAATQDDLPRRSEPVAVILGLQRSRFSGERQSRWLVSSVEDPQAPPGVN